MLSQVIGSRFVFTNRLFFYLSKANFFGRLVIQNVWPIDAATVKIAYFVTMFINAVLPVAVRDAERCDGR